MSSGKGRLEAEYVLLDYVTGQPSFTVPTSERYHFRRQPHSRFQIGVDGRIEPADALRSHLYGSTDRRNPPPLILDAPKPCALEIHLTRSVEDHQNRLQVFAAQPAKGGDARADAVPPAPKATGWWRAVYDGRYVNQPERDSTITPLTLTNWSTGLPIQPWPRCGSGWARRWSRSRRAQATRCSSCCGRGLRPELIGVRHAPLGSDRRESSGRRTATFHDCPICSLLPHDRRTGALSEVGRLHAGQEGIARDGSPSRHQLPVPA